MTTYLITAKKKEFTVKVEFPVIVEAENELEKFVGLNLMTLINICALRGYSIEKK